MVDKEIAWCPGCGDYQIRDCLEEVLKESKTPAKDFVFVSGIGQAAKMPQYLNVNYFNGLHGRSLPVACGIKLARPELTVVVTSGDGCLYGEGGNHFVHTIRKNPDITIIVCDNKVYALTKGQASPTSDQNIPLDLAPHGTPSHSLNPLALAIVSGAGFVARGFTGNKDQLKNIIKEAIAFKGTAIVDILQPCVSFNKVNTFKWYQEHTKLLEQPAADKYEAIKLAEKWDKEIPLGIIYRNNEKACYQSTVNYRKKITKKDLEEIISKYH